MTDMSKLGPDQGSAASAAEASTGDNSAAVSNLSYFGQLAAANHVKKLVERYLSLAPVFIGGPANTSLEAPPPQPQPPNHPPLNETEKGGMQQLQNANFQVINYPFEAQLFLASMYICSLTIITQLQQVLDHPQQ